MPPRVSYEQELLGVLNAVGQVGPEAFGLGILAPDEESHEELETFAPPQEPASPEPAAAPSRVTEKTLFAHPDSHPVILDLAMLYRYGADWLEWEPETIRHYTEADLGPMSDLNFSKVMAMKTLHLVEGFWKSWETFLWCTMPLNGLFPDFQVMQVPTVAQCLVSVDCANRVRDDVQWSGEVKQYLAVVHEHEGIFCTQPPVDFVKPDIEGLPVDCPDVQKRWPDVRRTGQAPKADTAEDEQLRRLLLVYEHLNESRLRLRGQLPLVQHG